MNSLVKNQTSICNEEALSKGTWVKLICGASNEDLTSIGDLCALYAKAGVHCIDVAADEGVVQVAREALDWVQEKWNVRPWLMISLSDGKDEHFRKACFDPKNCPTNCSRPCEKSCPVNAITSTKGVNSKLCYGCGRCLIKCPMSLIEEKDHNINLEQISSVLSQLRPDAIEIHTAPGRSKDFQAALTKIMAAKIPLQRVSVSCGLQGHDITIERLAKELWERHACLRDYGQKTLWQLDGQRMSGDLGKATASISVTLWKNIHALAPPGPLQLAGGTNAETIKYLPNQNGPSGIAFGSMARKLIKPWLLQAEANQIRLREWPEGWEASLNQAKQLINPWLARNSESKSC